MTPTLPLGNGAHMQTAKSFWGLRPKKHLSDWRKQHNCQVPTVWISSHHTLTTLETRQRGVSAGWAVWSVFQNPTTTVDEECPSQVMSFHMVKKVSEMNILGTIDIHIAIMTTVWLFDENATRSYSFHVTQPSMCSKCCPFQKKIGFQGNNEKMLMNWMRQLLLEQKYYLYFIISVISKCAASVYLINEDTYFVDPHHCVGKYLITGKSILINSTHTTPQMTSLTLQWFNWWTLPRGWTANL